jgi:hypothetical protein
MEPTLTLPKEKVTTIINIFKDSIKNIGDEIRRISSGPMILGLDGNPSKESLEAVRLRVCAILKEKALAPTILQHLNDPTLQDMYDIGSSFKVAHILGATTTGAIVRILPGIDGDSASALTYLALTEIADPKEESLYAAVDHFLSIDKRDEAGNVLLFPADEKKKIVTIAITILIRALLANELVEKAGNDSVQITQVGLGTINHLAAVDAVINIMEHSQIQNAAENLPKSEE